MILLMNGLKKGGLMDSVINIAKYMAGQKVADVELFDKKYMKRKRGWFSAKHNEHYIEYKLSKLLLSLNYILGTINAVNFKQVDASFRATYRNYCRYNKLWGWVD